MKTTSKLLPAVLATLMAGCVCKQPSQTVSGYTYIPIDPFAVETELGNSCGNDHSKSQLKSLLASFPDNAVRMMVEGFDASGSVTYGAGKIGAKGESYKVVVDYITADTVNARLSITKRMRLNDGSTQALSIWEKPDSKFIPGTETYYVKMIGGTKEENDTDLDSSLNILSTPPATATPPAPPLIAPANAEESEINIPVYVGVGLRASADIFVIEANANISGIGVLGIEAETKKMRGSLVIQTLGINGKSVSAALPIQSELNRTTAQNAVIAISSIKSFMYEEGVGISPRVVGFYLPIAGGKPLVNAIISALSKDRIKWYRPCQWSPENTASAQGTTVKKS